MLVVSANWGITDGSLGAAGGTAASGWLESVRRAALRQGFGRDGRYRPIDGIDIVLAGDTFDHLISTAWAGAFRPWHGSARAAELRSRVEAASIREGRGLLGGLARWMRRGLWVPAADRRGRPRMSTGVRIGVRVTLLAGDRDQGIEAAAADLGRFGFQVGRGWADDLVVVRHGAELDPLSGSLPCRHGGSDRPPTMRESLLVDLVARFGMLLRQAGHRPGLVGSLVGRLAGADLSDMPDIVARSMGAGFTAAEGSAAASDRLDPGQRQGPTQADGEEDSQRLFELWLRAIDQWHACALANRPVSGLGYCALDAIAAWVAAPATAAWVAAPTTVAWVAAPTTAAWVDAPGAHAGWPGRKAGVGPLPSPRFALPGARRDGLRPERCEVLGHLSAGFSQEGRDLRLPVICLGGSGWLDRPSIAAGESFQDWDSPGAGTVTPRGATMVGTRSLGSGIVWNQLADPVLHADEAA